MARRLWSPRFSIGFISIAFIAPSLGPGPVAEPPDLPPCAAQVPRNRVDAVAAERVTARQPREREPEGAPWRMLVKRFGGVIRATRIMPAARAEEIQHRRQCALIKPECAESGAFRDISERCHFRFSFYCVYGLHFLIAIAVRRCWLRACSEPSTLFEIYP